MGRVDGKVALVTGGARGQGRNHCVRLAEEGADIIAVDILEDYETVGAPLSRKEDLAETARRVEATGRRIVTFKADVRDLKALTSAVDEGVAQLGHLDVVCANAGITIPAAWDEITPAIWGDTIDTNLTGVWHTLVAATPHLIARGGGSIICTASSLGTKGAPYLAPYVASKHAVIGLTKAFANELSSHGIRVNAVSPTGVNTPMLDSFGGLSQLHEREPRLGPIFMNALDIATVEVDDVTNAVLYLASDESRYVTGIDLRVDAGHTIR